MNNDHRHRHRLFVPDPLSEMPGQAPTPGHFQTIQQALRAYLDHLQKIGAAPMVSSAIRLGGELVEVFEDPEALSLKVSTSLKQGNDLERKTVYPAGDSQKKRYTKSDQDR